VISLILKIRVPAFPRSGKKIRFQRIRRSVTASAATWRINSNQSRQFGLRQDIFLRGI
jgi:hypothetical protein